MARAHDPFDRFGDHLLIADVVEEHKDQLGAEPKARALCFFSSGMTWLKAIGEAPSMQTWTNSHAHRRLALFNPPHQIGSSVLRPTGIGFALRVSCTFIRFSWDL